MDHKFHMGEKVRLSREYAHITGVHGEVTYEGPSRQSDGDGARGYVSGEHISASVPLAAIHAFA